MNKLYEHQPKREIYLAIRRSASLSKLENAVNFLCLKLMKETPTNAIVATKKNMAKDMNCANIDSPDTSCRTK